MNRSLLVAMIVLTVLYGCAQASNPVERVEKQHGLDKQVREQQATELAPEPPTSEPIASEKPNLPEYNIMMDQDCSENFPQKCINAATDATSEEAFTLLTEHTSGTRTPDTALSSSPFTRITRCPRRPARAGGSLMRK
jgi:hypothetical protein